MNAQEKIRKGLGKLMSDGEANACLIYKGWGFYGYGWYYERFGQVATFMGDNLEQALDFIQETADERAEVG